MGRDGKLGEVETRIKLKRVMRYQHLSRDFVDEKDYLPSQEYANEKVWAHKIYHQIDVLH